MADPEEGEGSTSWGKIFAASKFRDLYICIYSVVVSYFYFLNGVGVWSTDSGSGPEMCPKRFPKRFSKLKQQ